MGRYLRSVLTLGVGTLVAAAAYWALLNVPESNVPALLLSAALVVAIAVVAGMTLAVAVAQSDGRPLGASMRRSIAALPLFAAGLLLFVVLAWTSNAFTTWWGAHRGEVDALAIRYAGFTNTAPLHDALAWLVWLVRWGLGLSILVAFVAVATLTGTLAIGIGLKNALRPVPLAVTLVALVAVTQGLWPLAPWRPASLPATSAEVYFSAAKLALLSVVTILLLGTAVAAHRRAVSARAPRPR